MLLTEEEAKERHCPFARQSDDSHSYNRWGDNFIRCLGSKCMAWQWTPAAGMGLSRDGYCGIAGNPNLASDIASQQTAAKDREAQ